MAVSGLCYMSVGLSVVALAGSFIFNCFLWSDMDKFKKASSPTEYLGSVAPTNWYLWSGGFLILAFVANSRSILLGIVLSCLVFTWFSVLSNWKKFQEKSDWSKSWEITWVGVFATLGALIALIVYLSKLGVKGICT